MSTSVDDLGLQYLSASSLFWFVCFRAKRPAPHVGGRGAGPEDQRPSNAGNAF